MPRIHHLARRRAVAALTLAATAGTGLAAIVTAAPAGAMTGPTTRVSVDQANGDSNGASPVNELVDLSDDGRYVVFSSDASDLVANDGNGKADVFRRDLASGVTHALDVKANATMAAGGAARPTISDDGRYVAFMASNDVIAGGVSGLFVRDMLGGITSDALGVAPSSPIDFPRISGNGRYVVFQTSATNLVAGEPAFDNHVDVYRRDLQLGTTVKVSVDTGAGQANGDSGTASISDDGRYVAFSSNADDLVTGDSNTKYDVFVRDMDLNVTTRVSTGPANQQLGVDTITNRISGDGAYVVMSTTAPEMDGSVDSDIVRKERATGAVVVATVDTAAGNLDQGIFGGSSISDDGRYVTFWSKASDAVPGDGNGFEDAFVRDLVAGETIRLSTDPAGFTLDSGAFAPIVSGNGARATFTSLAGDVVAGDGNGLSDIFVRGVDELAMSIGDVKVWEGQSKTAKAVFTVTLSDPAPAPVTFSWTTLAGSASAGSDFVAAGGTATIPAGKTFTTVGVTVKPDAADEPNETFAVQISGATAPVRIADRSGTATIVDDDPLAGGVVGLGIGDAVVYEGTGGATAVFTLRLSAPLATDTVVPYATVLGTASSADLTMKSAHVTIPAGKVAATVKIVVKGDVVGEPDETFEVVLGPVSIPVVDGAGLGTIRNAV